MMLGHCYLFDTPFLPCLELLELPSDPGNLWTRNAALHKSAAAMHTNLDHSNRAHLWLTPHVEFGFLESISWINLMNFMIFHIFNNLKREKTEVNIVLQQRLDVKNNKCLNQSSWCWIVFLGGLSWNEKKQLFIPAFKVTCSLKLLMLCLLCWQLCRRTNYEDQSCPGCFCHIGGVKTTSDAQQSSTQGEMWHWKTWRKRGFHFVPHISHLKDYGVLLFLQSSIRSIIQLPKICSRILA